MNRQEIADAAEALCNWFESQGLDSIQAAQIMTVTLAATIQAISNNNDDIKQKAIKLLVEDIAESMKEM